MSGPLIDLNGRVRDRSRERRQRRVTLGTRVVIGVVVIAALGWVLTASPLFSVREVKVVGNTSVPATTILQAAQVPMGVPLAQLDRDAIATRLMTVPGVGKGVVNVSLPGTVTLEVTERTVAFVVAADGGFALVDSSGVRYGQSTSKPSGVPNAQADPNDQQLLADVATVLGALPQSLARTVNLVVAPTRDSIVVKMDNGLAVTWGSADDSPLKGQTAAALAAAKPNCRAIDVSSPTQPTTHC